MQFYKITTNWTFGIDGGYSGCYWYFTIWCKTRYAGEPTGRNYGLGTIRFYRVKWWKTYYEKQKDGKMKVVWKGTILERKGGWKWFT